MNVCMYIYKFNTIHLVCTPRGHGFEMESMVRFVQNGEYVWKKKQMKKKHSTWLLRWMT